MTIKKNVTMKTIILGCLFLTIFFISSFINSKIAYAMTEISYSDRYHRIEKISADEATYVCINLLSGEEMFYDLYLNDEKIVPKKETDGISNQNSDDNKPK